MGRSVSRQVGRLEQMDEQMSRQIYGQGGGKRCWLVIWMWVIYKCDRIAG
jgi:hypothetical protein